MKKYLGLLLILICSVAVFSSCEKDEEVQIYELRGFCSGNATLSYEVISQTNPGNGSLSNNPNERRILHPIPLTSGDSLKINMTKMDDGGVFPMTVTLNFEDGNADTYILFRTIDKNQLVFDTVLVIP